MYISSLIYIPYLYTVDVRESEIEDAENIKKAIIYYIGEDDGAYH